MYDTPWSLFILIAAVARSAAHNEAKRKRDTPREHTDSIKIYAATAAQNVKLKPEADGLKKRLLWLDSELNGFSRISIAHNQDIGPGLFHTSKLHGHISNGWNTGSKAEQRQRHAAIKIDTRFKRIAAKLRSWLAVTKARQQ